MKKFFLIAGSALVLSTMSVSCKKAANDAELQTQANTVVTAQAGASVEVKDGVAHLSGTFPDAASKDKMIQDLKAIKGVKDVHDMATVSAATVPAVTETTTVDTTTGNDPAAFQKVQDAVKDFPSVKAENVNGEIIITGNVSQTQARKIKESVDALNLKNVKYNYIVK